MIAIIDYGVGNLQSVKNALDLLNIKNIITSSPADIEAADGLILPGVGAFAGAVESFKKSGLLASIKKSINAGKPFLGICLGMQIMFSAGEEDGLHEGFAFFEGTVKKLPSGVKIPHMGWNRLYFKNAHPIINGVEEGSFVYFVHSYYAEAADKNIRVAVTPYGLDFPAIVAKGNLMGTQFHPEKSGETGLKILKNFGEMCNAR